MRALLFLLLAGAAAPALAQHSGHAQPVAPAAAAPSSCTPEHAAMGHCTLPPATPPPPPASTCTPEHAALGHCKLPTATPPPPPPASTCTPEHAALGHCTLPPAQGQGQAADPHAGHDMADPATEIPLGPPPAEARSGPEHAADAAWGQAAMAPGRAVLFQEHGDNPVAKLLIDRIEARVRDGRDGYGLDAEGWWGGDIDKVWLKAEVEGAFGGRPEQAELQALWSHAIDPWFDLQAGLRYDFAPASGPAHLVLGVQGLAPYWIEVDAAAFVSTRGDVTARIEAEHDARLTRRLVLQPRAEVEFALQDVPREGIGSGLSTAELGLRLRYEIEPNVAPYVGVQYDRAFAGTRKLRRREGEELGGLSFVAGIRAWF
jgi:copper resistance protein B